MNSILEENYTYDAFISYRHLPHDKAIAEKLQKLLESYKPPKECQYRNTNSIKRVFRDESELPTSGDLGADIKKALRQSNYLIVVCSEETAKSNWCMQEIKYFKELHNGNNEKILTILVSGNPREAFPKELCYETRLITLDDGSAGKQTVEVEPLAANVVTESTAVSLRKLNTEFLRIAAPILGCGYDDLYRRHQRRFIRNFIIAATLIGGTILSFSAFSYAQAIRIKSQSIEITAKTQELQIAYNDLTKKNADLEYSNQKLSEQIEETTKQKNLADENSLLAEKQADIARENERKAIENQQEAEAQKALALANEKLANQNGQKAILAKGIAEENEKKANIERDEALKNQSINLANLSKQYFEQGDKTKAMITALEGLPADLNNPERPYVKETDGALLGAIYSGGNRKAAFEHLSKVDNVVFSQDNKKILTIEDNNTAHVWDATNTTEIFSVINVLSADLNLDGDRLLTTRGLGIFEIWDANNGRLLFDIKGDANIQWLGGALFSPDGTKIVLIKHISSLDNIELRKYPYKLEAYDAKSGSCISEIGFELKGNQTRMYFDDNKILLAGEEAGYVKIFNMEDWKELNSLSLENYFPQTSWVYLDYKADSILAYKLNDETVYIFDAVSGKEIGKLGHKNFIQSAQFNADGKRIVTTSNDYMLHIWDAESGKELMKISLSGFPASGFAKFSPDGNMVISAVEAGNGCGDVCIWDANTGKKIRELKGHLGSVISSSFSSDNSQIITGSEDCTAILWDLEDFKGIKKIDAIGSSFATFKYSSDGKTLLTATTDGKIQIWDAETYSEILQINKEGKIYNVDFVRDDTWILTEGSGIISIFDLHTGLEVSNIRIEKGQTYAAHSPDGRFIATFADNNTVNVWEIESSRRVAELKGHEFPLICAVFSPDSKRIVTGSYDDTACIWDISTGRQVSKLWNTNDVRYIGFSKDGSTILTNDGYKPWFWNAKTEKDLWPTEEKYSVKDAFYSEDGSKIISISDGKTVHVWNSETNEEIVNLELKGGKTGSYPYKNPKLSSDGTKILTESSDGIIRIWDAEDGIEFAQLSEFSSMCKFSPNSNELLILSKDLSKIIFINLDTQFNINFALSKLNV